MLERGLQFTERRSLKPNGALITAFFCEVLVCGEPDETGTKSVDFAKGSTMPEVIFTGPAGRLEGRYHPAKQKNAPIAMVLHPHPQFHGTMNHQIIYQCYYAFAHRGFSVLRFNFRGVGRSQGSFDHGTGELSDAASALDWAQTINPEARACWVAGFSFGAWIGMQLLMRRPEVEGFISIEPLMESVTGYLDMRLANVR